MNDLHIGDNVRVDTNAYLEHLKTFTTLTVNLGSGDGVITSMTSRYQGAVMVRFLNTTLRDHIPVPISMITKIAPKCDDCGATLDENGRCDYCDTYDDSPDVNLKDLVDKGY